MKIFCPFCNAARDASARGLESEVFVTRKVCDAGRRQRAKCNRCGSIERERMLKWCLEGFRYKKKRTLLHFAPSQATHKWLSEQTKLDITATDLQIDLYRHADNIVASDINALVFEDNSFDYVICSHVMEHIPDDVGAFAEIKRVLKSNGKAFFMVPLIADGKGAVEDPDVTDPAERLEKFGQSDHVRIYDPATFNTRMKAGGLFPRVFNPYSVDPMRAVAYGIPKGSAVFIGYVRPPSQIGKNPVVRLALRPFRVIRKLLRRALKLI